MGIDLIEVEVADLPALRPEEASLLDMHSMLNILNVLQGELEVIGLTLAREANLLKDGLAVCRELTEALRDRSKALQDAAALPSHRARVMAEVERTLQAHADRRASPEIAESLANLESVFAIFEVRAHEVLARAKHPGRWETMRIENLRHNFLEVFAAIEKNSKGRYRIIYNLARQEPTDYYVRLDFDSVDGKTVFMPPVFQDVMRDLIANARKYTAPGGIIAAGLFEGQRELRFVVHDTGRGIPEPELKRVVEFGRRGSNVSEVRTMGGGFGLTKAYYVTKQFGGRMWIASRVDIGTRISIALPRAGSV
ncbi:MAG TPA: sensor histidine kinase [Opitutaceae bacterium]|nr:sensor histidine kinase [Opitutaceae bacterium]